MVQTSERVVHVRVAALREYIGHDRLTKMFTRKHIFVYLFKKKNETKKHKWRHTQYGTCIRLNKYK